MKRYFIFLSVFLFSFLVYKPASAATTTNTAKAMQWHCLNVVVCSTAGANCHPGVAGHRAKLTTKSSDLPTKGAQTTPFVCVGTNQGNICTSGDSVWDLQTVGYDGLSRLKQTVSFEFQGLFKSDGTDISAKSIYANDQGKLSEKTGAATNTYRVVEPLEMQDYTPVSLPRKWLALNTVQVKQEVPSGKGGQQQATFTFEGALGKCVAISWDPYGIVFDSQSLEPVAGVKVTLTKKRDNGLFTIAFGDDAPSILNPVTTVEDGAFEFFVPDGTYKLDVSSPNFTFPNDSTKLQANYSKIYSELYRGEEIIEKGKALHRDVPIDSKTTPYHSAVKLMAYFPMLDKTTNTFIIQGRVSHPLTKINVYGEKPAVNNSFSRTRLLMSLSADKKGQFEIRYNMNNLAPSEIIGDIELVKIDYTTLQEETTNKNNPLFVTEPILNHIEGYAYNTGGQPMANATVGVYLNYSNIPAYETTTDENGFFRMASEYLPTMTYGLRYTAAGGQTYSVKTSDFIAQNAKYLEAQNANLFSYKNQNGQPLNLTEKGKQSNGLIIPTKQENQQRATEAQRQTNSLIILISLMLIIVGIGGIVMVIYFVKKNKPIQP